MSPIAKLKIHLLNWREWELNPIVIKELRQSVRSWAVTGTLLLFLAVLFFASLGFLISQSFEVHANQRIGAEIFQVFMILLTGASLTFIPLYVGIRLAAERQESNLDLLYVTTLTPERVIRGKFFCGAYMAVLFFSACMPFMAFTNLLRGVDLPTISFILVCLFLVVCAAIQAAIFLACLPITKLLKIVLAIMGIIGVFSIIAPLIYFFLEMMRAGIGATMTGRDFWIVFATVSGVVFAAVLLLYFLSVALISPLSANRALPVRRYITLTWILGGLLSVAWVIKEADARLVLPWAIVSFIVLVSALTVVISNYDQLSFRVRAKIPENPAKRALAFLFYNGAAGGLTWVALLMAVTWIGTISVLQLRGFSTLPADELRNFQLTSAAVVFYVFAYALTGLLIHRQLAPRRPPRLAGVLALLLPGVWALAPNILFFFLNRLSWRSVERSQLGNIFNVFIVRDTSQQIAHVICAAAWLVIMLVFCARWYFRQLKHFRPLERTVVAPISSHLPPATLTAIK